MNNVSLILAAISLALGIVALVLLFVAIHSSIRTSTLPPLGPPPAPDDSQDTVPYMKMVSDGKFLYVRWIGADLLEVVVKLDPATLREVAVWKGVSEDAP